MIFMNDQLMILVPHPLRCFFFFFFFLGGGGGGGGGYQ